jgi:hypothetical protein
MEDNKVLIGALIFILLVVGSNFVMYAIARGAARPGGNSFWTSIIRSVNTAQAKKNDEMEQLRQKVQELSDTGGNKPEDPE